MTHLKKGLIVTVSFAMFDIRCLSASGGFDVRIRQSLFAFRSWPFALGLLLLALSLARVSEKTDSAKDKQPNFLTP
jgi:hypothetical protein